MTQMLMPTPFGLRTPARFVEHDVYNVCQRIKEIDTSLQLVLQEGHKKPWVVMENCADGNVRMVSRYEELSPAILDDLRRMLAIPFQTRIEQMEREFAKENDAAQKHRETEEWQRFVYDFRKTLRECGFTHDQNYVSRPNDGKRRKRGGA